MTTAALADGPLKHNHFRFENPPSEIIIQYKRRVVMTYECMHVRGPNGNLLYTHTRTQQPKTQKFIIQTAL